MKLFLDWYKVLLAKRYGVIISLSHAWYNSKYWTPDGTRK